MEKISVLVPVYNSEKYLRKCVESILKQTYENIELILVNDGSTDSSYEIMEEYKEKDKRVKAIHIDNKGVANARNVLLDNATGEYYTYVDSDDWIEHNYLQELYNELIKENADICVGNCVQYVENTGEYKHKDFGINKNCVYNRHEAVEELMYHNFLRHSPWGKLYKKEVFEGMRFPIEYHYEDLALIYKLFLKADKIVYTPIEKYNYMVREGSIVHRKLKEEDINAILNYSEEIISVLEKEAPEILNCGKYSLLMHSVKILSNMKLKQDKEYVDRIMNIFKKYRKVVIQDKKANKKYKVFFIISYFGRYVLKLSLNLKNVVIKN